MHLFYHPEDLNVEHVALSDSESAHASQVLRLTNGDAVQVTNGAGLFAEAHVELIAKKKCVLKIDSTKTLERERKARIHIAIAPTKSIDRFELFLEKATEIGVDRITPIICEHSERRKVRHDRSLKVMVAAMKQSQRSWLPQIDELTSLKNLLKEELPAKRSFGWCDGTHQNFMDWYEVADSLVLIGPEGDFSTNEADQLKETGFSPVSIGTTRLRTETAGIAACSWMSLLQQK